jgi:hypothetical protein
MSDSAIVKLLAEQLKMNLDMQRCVLVLMRTVTDEDAQNKLVEIMTRATDRNESMTALYGAYLESLRS